MRCNTRNQQERGKSSDITNEKGKATVMDGIPVEVWKCLGEGGIDMLWDLMQMIYEQEKMPTEWRDSVIIPIYKEKGDIQECGNYRGIKLIL